MSRGGPSPATVELHAADPVAEGENGSENAAVAVAAEREFGKGKKAEDGRKGSDGKGGGKVDCGRVAGDDGKRRASGDGSEDGGGRRRRFISRNII